MASVSIWFLIHTSKVLNVEADCGRTIREWGRRFESNVTPEVLLKDFPSMTRDPVTFEAFRRKWRYLFAYAAAGLAHGYLTSHMFTFIRTVRMSPLLPRMQLTFDTGWDFNC